MSNFTSSRIGSSGDDTTKARKLRGGSGKQSYMMSAANLEDSKDNAVYELSLNKTTKAKP